MNRIIKFGFLIVVLFSLLSTPHIVLAFQPKENPDCLNTPSGRKFAAENKNGYLPLAIENELKKQRIADVPLNINSFDFSSEDYNLDLISKILIALIFTLGISSLAMLTALIFPKNTSTIAQCFADSPGVSWAVGLLTLFSSFVALIITTITLILIPVSLAGVIVLIGAQLLGYVSLGYWIGHKISESAKSAWSDPIAAGIGTLILSIVISSFSLIPSWVGNGIAAIMIFIVSMFGLGSVTLTIFGSKSYPRLKSNSPPLPNQTGSSLNAHVGLGKPPSITEISETKSKQDPLIKKTKNAKVH